MSIRVYKLYIIYDSSTLLGLKYLKNKSYFFTKLETNYFVFSNDLVEN